MPLEYANDPRAEAQKEAFNTHVVNTITGVHKRLNVMDGFVLELVDADFDEITASDKAKIVSGIAQVNKIAANIRSLMEGSEILKIGTLFVSSALPHIVNASRSLLEYVEQYKHPTRNPEFSRLVNMLRDKIHTLEEACAAKLHITPRAREMEILNKKASLQAQYAEVNARPVQGKLHIKGGFAGLSVVRAADISGKSLMDRVNEKFDALTNIEDQIKRLDLQQKEIQSMSIEDVAQEDSIRKATMHIHKAAQYLSEAVEKAGVGTRVAFAVLKGAIIVRGQIDRAEFERRDFMVTPLAGQFIISDQTLVAVYNRPPGKVENTEPILTRQQQDMISKIAKNLGGSSKSKKPEAKPAKKDKVPTPPPDLTPSAVLDIIKAQTGETWIDVAGASLNRHPYQMMTRDIKHVSFIWLMRASDYRVLTRNRPMQIQEVSLPSKGR